MDVIAPRSVALGSNEGIRVRRTLPTRLHSTIGGWCFLDHYGPGRTAMEVGPHPHIGLQTASWLFSGEVDHRDSAGFAQRIRPGALNLMTAGRGITHSELSPSNDAMLHGVQLWIALPDDARFTAPTFEHHEFDPVVGTGWQATVFVGDLLGSTSAATVHSPLMGAEIHLDAEAEMRIPIQAAFEHGVLVDSGDVLVNGQSVDASSLAWMPPGERTLTITARTPARILLLGGEPLGEQLVMWWNFVGRSHDEIADAREAWQDDQRRAAMFGTLEHDALPLIPAPPMPTMRLKPRG